MITVRHLLFEINNMHHYYCLVGFDSLGKIKLLDESSEQFYHVTNKFIMITLLNYLLRNCFYLAA
ncbi:hypothetical protein HBA_0875 [Sodalis endosymbiont of Henestaris halophilus]|nr:hypothetical protein HBA_0875 [Sodalis endosymbiont of Henestaris halophilus]